MITLLVILICLGLDYGLNVNSRYRPTKWFSVYEKTILKWAGEKVKSQPWIVVTLLLLPVLLLLGILQSLFSLSNFTQILFSVLVLWASLSTGEWRAKILDYIDEGNNTSGHKAQEDLAALLSEGHTEEAPTITQENTFGNKLKDAIFWQAHEQLFGVIFWFIVLGPLGAGLYRVIWLMCHRSRSTLISKQTADLMEQIHGVAAWLPARTTALTYCLVGNWHPSWGAWAKNALRPGFSRGLLVECGNLAMDTTGQDERQKVKAALSLVTRTLVAWLLLLLLAVLLS